MKDVPGRTLTVNGVAYVNKQIMVTYDEKSWNETLELMGQVRDADPLFATGGYAPEKTPLQGGPLVQSTALMSLGRPLSNQLLKH